MNSATTLAPPGAVVRFLEPYLKLPAGAPHVPAGGREARAFRAAPGYLKYRYVKLGLASLVAIPEIVGVMGGLFAWNVWVGMIVTGIICIIAAGIVMIAAAAIRLEYDLRQYLVTDRALRIRGGAIAVIEVTITYANIQDVEISQGPLQRMFGIADLIVHTAGGSSMGKGEKGGGMSHRGNLAGISDPRELRDYILERLRIYRDSGLGDPDDPRTRLAHAAAAGEIDANAGPAPENAALQSAITNLREAANELRAAAQ